METSSDYCARIVRERDEDRWLAIQYAPVEFRRALIALYSFDCELERIPTVVSEPPLGEIRLQWQRDALAEIRSDKPARAHPVIEEIAASGLGAQSYAPLIDHAINAASRPLYGDAFTDFADALSWSERRYGAFDAAAVLVCGGEDELARAASRAGALFAMARRSHVFAPTLSAHIKKFYDEEWMQLRDQIKTAKASVVPALLPLFLTPSYIANGDRSFAIRKRLILFRAMLFGA